MQNTQETIGSIAPDRPSADCAAAPPGKTHGQSQGTSERRLQAERLSAVGEAIAGLAHASRNALQRSQACLEMLATELQDNSDALNLIGRIQTAQDDLHQLYEKVREYAAPLKLDPQPQPVFDAIRDAWQALPGTRAGRAVLLQEEFSTTDLSCEIDRPAIAHVFFHLFKNAMTACADPVEITVGYRSDSLRGKPALRITVHDNGPGFAADERRRAFRPFYETRARGSSLGLATCRRIIEAHHGEIGFEPPAEGAGEQKPLGRGVNLAAPLAARLELVLPRSMS